ncbi:MAG: hypothetical protein K0S76_524 [Herbinix sp.]|jgi:hypothetical protein|nr:hypothetical protein [Herbinix sp.]
MIDHGNIHGWLQERVSQVEYKYAYCVTHLMQKSPDAFHQVKNILKNNGTKLGHSLTGTDLSAPYLYKVISDNLLDGMPCDHANCVVDQSPEEIEWKRNVCVHSPYWEETDGDIKLYYDLRDAWLLGMINACGYQLIKIDPVTYRIKK